MASDISKTFKLNIVGLRFFTVYGPWGRPDMFLMKFLNSIYNKKKFYLFNKGIIQEILLISMMQLKL